MKLQPSTWTTAGATLAIGLLSGGLAVAATGNIHPAAIEIDQHANLQPASGSCISGFVNGPVLNAGAMIDWVADCAPNTDAPSLVDSVATGIKTSAPDQTGAAAVGHWNGCRIVDGIDGNDRDIFLNGGKENDVSTWNIGPGSVGSSKYDMAQAYLANNQTMLFFGMERRGNNGTTAFDFEFNQAGPDPATPLIPTRSLNDVLFTFEMQGSGGSGSAVPHVFLWNGTAYAEFFPNPALATTINQVDTPAAPWGYVDSRGRWTLGNIPRFEFAEAAAPLSMLPGINVCGGAAFVQVRTRASVSPTSDLKDASKIFRFVFGGPSAEQRLATACAQFSHDGGLSRDSGGGADLSYAWDFTVPDGVTLSGTGVTQDPDNANLFHSSLASGTVDVTFPADVDTASILSSLTVTDNGSGCVDATADAALDVIRLLPGSAIKVGADGGSLTVHLEGSAPNATSIQWQKLAGGTWVDVGAAVDGSAADLHYSSFEGDAAPTAISFGLGGDSFFGKEWDVDLRVHATRTSDSPDGSLVTCESDSPAVRVRKVTAVDP